MSVLNYLKKMGMLLFSYLPSEIKIFFYRMAGARIGAGTEIGLGSLIIPYDSDFKKINIGTDVSIGERVKILAKRVTLEDHAQIKDECRIWGESEFSMGKYAYVDQRCGFDLRYPITLEERVGIGGGSWMYTHGVFLSILDGAPSEFGPIVIHDHVWVGANVFILPGITIGAQSIIGARTVVTRDVLPDSIVVGNPGRQIAKTSEKTKKLTLQDKIAIVRKVLLLFTERNAEYVNHISDDENNLVFQYYNHYFAFIPEATRDSFQKFISEKKTGPASVISFNISDDLIGLFKEKGIFWFDMEKGTQSSTSNKYHNRIRGFLGDHGLT
jgi:acetyltransferase-like isoleucine patch superfamily enzyme